VSVVTDIDTSALDTEIAELVETAERVLHEQFGPRHRTAAAVRTADGETFTGLHLDATISTEATHAEPVAVANAVLAHDGDGENETGTGDETDAGEDDPTAGDPEIVAVAAVSKLSDDDEAGVIPPCGSCREVLADYATDARIVVPGEDGDRPRSRPLAELLPSDVMEITDHPRFD
jgi:cytidine deaminase